MKVIMNIIQLAMIKNESEIAKDEKVDCSGY